MAGDPRRAQIEGRADALVLAGVDVILSPDRGWVVLEVNDHPSGLAGADALGAADGEGGVVRAVAAALARRASERCVCLLLPEPFRLADGRAQSVTAPGVSPDDRRTTHALADFNTLAAELRRLGVPAVITDVDGVRMDGAEVVLADGTRVGALYRRASSFPPREPRCACVNDLRVRAICPDKKRTASLLGARGIAVPGALNGSRPRWVIAKPNFGSASEGVVRMTSDDAALEPLLRDGATVVQEWVEPATTPLRARRHYFDVRVYVVDNRVVGRVARLAAAPYDEPTFAASPLSWLTTMGRWQPVRAGARAADGAVVLPSMRIAELDALCTRVVRTLDAAAGALEYARAVESVPSFQTLAAIDGPLRRIELVAAR